LYVAVTEFPPARGLSKSSSRTHALLVQADGQRAKPAITANFARSPAGCALCGRPHTRKTV